MLAICRELCNIYGPYELSVTFFPLRLWRGRQLGFDPCYHMVEVIENNHANVWYEFATDQSNDWERVRLHG